MLLDDLLLYLGSFLAIWFGAGLIISSIDGFSRRLRISTFSLSFFVLGILTSLPEFAVGLTSISQNDPEIFVGNLLGGIAVIFLLVIPLLAILSGGIKLSSRLDKKTLFFSLAVIAVPSVCILDHKVTIYEGFFCLLTYLFLFAFIEQKKKLASKKNQKILSVNAYSLSDILRLLAGVVLVFLSSQIIVDNTVLFSQVLNVSPFLMSLVVLSLGTNLPELSLAIRAVLAGKTEIALADYLGSAAANTLLFGGFTLLNGGEVLTTNGFVITFLSIVIAVALFYYFSRSERNISRKEGFILLLGYLVFVFFELNK